MKTVYLLLALLPVAACQQAEHPPSSDTTSRQAAPAATVAAAPAVVAPAVVPRTAAPEGASVFIIAPANGATVTSPVHVVFGAANVTIVPAGTDAPASGHHHLIIDADLPDPAKPIPSNDNYIHFGSGATSTELQLGPGEHHLKLLLGDRLHIPHKPPIYSDTIAITVVE